jgi:gamma-glutamyltranspeptidase/glutathione hydrolase
VIFHGQRERRYIGASEDANAVVDHREDFARYEATVVDGVRGRYKGFDIVTSSGMTGGLTLLEMLNLAERLDLGAHKRFGGQCLHLLTEIMRQAWTDRFVYVGDPAGATVPADALIDKAYAASVLPHISPDRAPTKTRPGDPWQFSWCPDRVRPTWPAIPGAPTRRIWPPPMPTATSSPSPRPSDCPSGLASSPRPPECCWLT